jgi:hypothetical protein
MKDILALSGTGQNDVWAGALDGTVWHFDGGGWNAMKLPVPGTLIGIFALNQRSVWAVSLEGDVFVLRR